MTATPAMYVAATTAMQKHATDLVNQLPMFEQSMARQALFRAGLLQGFAKAAVDAALAAQEPPPKPPAKAKEDAKT